MKEILNIWQDIKTGALPPDQITGFIAWLLKKIAWMCLGLIFVASVIFIIAR